MEKLDFDYYYGNEAEQFNFYRIPKALFTDERFKKISCEAKVLYGLMLDRMGLSVRNEWFDTENRVYIVFTLQDAIEYLNCGKDKCVNLFKELEESAGLIERKKQGQGRPAIIYVKNFVKPGVTSIPTASDPSVDKCVDKLPEDNEQPCIPGSSESEKPDDTGLVSDFGFSEVKTSAMSEVKTSENQKSRLRLSRSQDFGKTDPNDTNINNNNLSDTENQSINQYHPSISNGGARKKRRSDGMDRYTAYREILEDNLEYGVMSDTYGKERMDETIEILLDAICSTNPYLRINKSDVPTEVVRSRLLKLNCFHVEYVFDMLDKNTTLITNIKAYLLTAFYNAPSTIDQYYKSLVNHDMHHGPD